MSRSRSKKKPAKKTSAKTRRRSSTAAGRSAVKQAEQDRGASKSKLSKDGRWHITMIAESEGLESAEVARRFQKLLGPSKAATEPLATATNTSLGPHSAAELEEALQQPIALARAAFDRIYVDQVMAETQGNQSAAARRAGMSRSGFRELLVRVGVLD